MAISLLDLATKNQLNISKLQDIITENEDGTVNTIDGDTTVIGNLKLQGTLQHSFNRWTTYKKNNNIFTGTFQNEHIIDPSANGEFYIAKWTQPTGTTVHDALTMRVDYEYNGSTTLRSGRLYVRTEFADAFSEYYVIDELHNEKNQNDCCFDWKLRHTGSISDNRVLSIFTTSEAKFISFYVEVMYTGPNWDNLNFTISPKTNDTLLSYRLNLTKSTPLNNTTSGWSLASVVKYSKKVDGRFGVGTSKPKKLLDVAGDVGAANMTCNGHLSSNTLQCGSLICDNDISTTNYNVRKLITGKSRYLIICPFESNKQVNGDIFMNQNTTRTYRSITSRHHITFSSDAGGTGYKNCSVESFAINMGGTTNGTFTPCTLTYNTRTYFALQNDSTDTSTYPDYAHFVGQFISDEGLFFVSNADVSNVILKNGVSGKKQIYANSSRFLCDVVVEKSASCGSSFFNIPHILTSKTSTHRLVHSAIHAPKPDIIYSGMVNLVNGIANVNMDTVANMSAGTFKALCKSVRYSTTNESGFAAVKSSFVDETLTITCQDSTSQDKVFWQVFAQRQDPHIINTAVTDTNGNIIVEPLVS